MPDHYDLLSRAEAVERVITIHAEALGDRPAESVPLERIAGWTTAEPVIADAGPSGSQFLLE